MIYIFAFSGIFMNIGETIVKWYHENARDLPWRMYPNPYNIWVSEIILQQTQMERGVEYYNRFIENFPDVYELSRTEESEILKMWQGLGYYSRARNMLKAARQIVNDFNGTFPYTYEDLIQLKGVGDYTACAILSIAFEKPYVVADGNVIRLITRLFAIDEASEDKKTILKIKSIATEMMNDLNPSFFNQGLMEMGALICKPGYPLCNICPVHDVCMAAATNTQQFFPVKKPKVKKTQRLFHYFVLIDPAQNVLLCQRNKNDIWKGLWEFPLIETKTEPIPGQLIGELFTNPEKNRITSSYKFSKKHILTHQVIMATFYIFEMKELPNDGDVNVRIPIIEISQYPVHNLMRWGVEQISEWLGNEKNSD